jgi:tRNA pseudouridine55 synthase
MNPGFLVVDKPAGITSHDVVAMVRAVTGLKKVGHTGTLDPFATGVLPLALGGATRLISFLDEDLKIYDARVQLGSATDTGDPTGTVIRTADVPELTDERIREALATFRGVRMQAPPKYSAVKIHGKPLYRYAREGIEVEAAPRPTRIDGIELLDRGADWLQVRIECGRGTYARVLADEIAQALGTAGHLRELRRTRSGPFHEGQAISLERLSDIVAERPDWMAVLKPARGAERVKWRSREVVAGELAAHALAPVQALAQLRSIAVSPAHVGIIERGEVPPGDEPAGTHVGDLFLLLRPDASLLAIARREPTGPRIARLLSKS